MGEITIAFWILTLFIFLNFYIFINIYGVSKFIVRNIDPDFSVSIKKLALSVLGIEILIILLLTGIVFREWANSDLISSSLLGFLIFSTSLLNFPFSTILMLGFNSYNLLLISSIIFLGSCVSFLSFKEILGLKELRERMIYPKMKYSKFLKMEVLIFIAVFGALIIITFPSINESKIVGLIYKLIFNSLFSDNIYYSNKLQSIVIHLSLGFSFSLHPSIVCNSLLFKLRIQDYTIFIVLIGILLYSIFYTSSIVFPLPFFTFLYSNFIIYPHREFRFPKLLKQAYNA